MPQRVPLSTLATRGERLGRNKWAKAINYWCKELCEFADSSGVWKKWANEHNKAEPLHAGHVLSSSHVHCGGNGNSAPKSIDI